MPDISYQVSIDEPRWKKALPGYKEIIQNCLNVLSSSGVSRGSDEISLLLTNDTKIRELNKTYRGKDKATNVLSFPQDEPGMLGDVIMALETLEIEAKEQEKTFQDHFTHLFVHGVLHLLGHDHMQEAEQAEMEAMEIKILKALGIDNPY